MQSSAGRGHGGNAEDLLGHVFTIIIRLTYTYSSTEEGQSTERKGMLILTHTSYKATISTIPRASSLGRCRIASRRLHIRSFFREINYTLYFFPCGIYCGHAVLLRRCSKGSRSFSLQSTLSTLFHIIHIPHRYLSSQSLPASCSVLCLGTITKPYTPGRGHFPPTEHR